MSEESYDAEFTVIRKKSKRVRLLQGFLISAYAAFALLYAFVFLVLFKMPQVIAILPILLWIFVFFTWRYLHVEYRTAISGGRISFSRILTDVKKEKLLVSLKIADARRILPAFLLEGELRDHAKRILDLRGGGEATDAYCILYDDSKGVTHAILFRATRKMLRLFLRYHPKGTVESDNLIY